MKCAWFLRPQDERTAGLPARHLYPLHSPENVESLFPSCCCSERLRNEGEKAITISSKCYISDLMG